MSKKFWGTRLGVELIIATVFSIFVSSMMFTALTFIEFKILQEKLRDREFIEQNTQRVVEELQDYIDENHISSRDMPAVDKWVRDRRNVVLMIYDGNRVIYDSAIVDFLNTKSNFQKDNNHYRELYDIVFMDKSMKIEMLCFFEYPFNTQVNYLKIAISFSCFVAILLLFIKRKTEYINRLAGEIGILEGGNLEYKIAVKGKDELAYLAQSIDDMRIAFIERQQEEQNTINLSHKLITAMSHDLKTPLTILIGYLDILEGKKLRDLQQQDLYIKKCRDKAYQIKQLSDKIFDYFLAVDINADRLQKKYFDISVIHEMLGDYIFTLEEKGYQVFYVPKEAETKIYIDIQYIHRVFDNIFSNMIKYADIQKPISIQTRQEDAYYCISIENGINMNLDCVESSNIGLETCRNIMEQHNGFFLAEKRDDQFWVEIQFQKIKK